jgi:isoleucyl-tRNA synthetase
MDKSEQAKREEATLAFWKKERIFEKTLEKPSPKGEFVFYEGPPTANGKPGIHHLEARAFKDAIPRYKTMRGYRVRRRAGWDTHGLPVELEVEKELGFSGKPDIETYGVAAFNKKCRESVFRYIDLWEKFTERIGYWVDKNNAYFTFDPSYMESVWHVIKKASDDGRLYKDYKVLPWCARCGTALSSHELAQGYEDVKDLSLTAKFELVDEPGTSILAWTTTPWTLPGNVALAVGKDIEYGVYEKDGAKVIAANLRGEAFGLAAPLRTLKGSDLVGKTYKPLFDILSSLSPQSEKPKFENAYTVYAGDFVTTEDGTGIVHTAVMYGQEDFDLGTAVGLPKVHAVGADGRFLKGTGFLEGRFVRDEEVTVDIIKDLAAKGLLFSKEKYEHSYPFCWRCKTPLIYYARDSWYIRMHDLRDVLVRENNTINWTPEYIKEGRMGEWLQNVKDWAVSRERYWGTPLPVWESEGGEKRIVIGSIEELKRHHKKSHNTYLFMRHGEAESNTRGVLNSKDREKYGLTEKGKEQVLAAASELKGKGVTKVFCSPFRRARETANIIVDALQIPREKIIFDERLREFDFGDLDGESHAGFIKYRIEKMTSCDARISSGESYQEAKERVGGFMSELHQTYQNETILIVGHGIVVESATLVAEGLGGKEAWVALLARMPRHAVVYPIDFAPLSQNERYEIDLHRPYIDDVVLVGEDGTEYRRVKEVMDVWLDSGSMPFAEDHYPFENKSWIEGRGYPADFISEAIDQTRGWFYTLLAVGTLMGRAAPYKNVICLGHLLDAEGKKMSKSKGNVVDPWTEIERWGADVVRFWMYFVNQPGDSKNYDEKTVKEAARVLSWLENSAKFYETFKNEQGARSSRKQVLDNWILARTHDVLQKVTQAMDAYNLYEATRTLAELFEDLSQWYVRRARDRVREGDPAARETLRSVLKDSARMLAPFAPFLAEEVYQKVKNARDPESVHLALWPHKARLFGSMFEKSHEVLMKQMGEVRSAASLLLKKRQEAGVNVRQPLNSVQLTIESRQLSSELLELLKDEVNVKEVTFGKELALDTTITPELQKEGNLRNLIRELQDFRKEANLVPSDVIDVVIYGGPYPNGFEEELKKAVNARKMEFGESNKIKKVS